MGNWRVILKQGSVSVGMWKEDAMVYFTVSDLTPDDIHGKDVEIPFTIIELEKIVQQAKIYEKEMAED